MQKQGLYYAKRLILAISLFILGGSYLFVLPVAAQVEQGDINITATVYGPPPTTQAVIVQPLDGTTLETTPLVVQGTCGPDLLVRVFDNNVLAGSIVCATDGTFTMNITLNIGENVLTALNYDIQDQPGPTSPSVTITVTPPPDVIEEDQPVGTIDNDTVVLETENTTPRGTTATDNADVPLFEDTFLEPATKLLDINVLVTPPVKVVFSAVIRVIFVSVLAAPLLWIGLIFWFIFSER